MKPSILYRSAAVLLVLFAAGHTFGFSRPDPSWGADTLVGSMRSLHFDVMGSHRSYWDLFLAAGYCVGIFYLFCAVLAWQLGGLPPETLARMRLTTWGFAVTFVAVAIVSWGYLFLVPIAFSAAIALCLIAAAWLSSR